jgi:hypothetical protein
LQRKVAAAEPARENALAIQRREEMDALYARVEAMTPEEKAAEEARCQRASDALRAKWATRDAAIAQREEQERARARAALIERQAAREERRLLLLEQAQAMAEEVK